MKKSESSAAIAAYREAVDLATAPPLDARKYLFNRELSWLEFNRRVLEEALDTSHPLLERLKFLAIFSTNLDEYFMIRVSGLQEKLEEESVELSPDGMTPAEQLREISNRIRPMLAEHNRCLTEDVLPALAAQGIVVNTFSDLNEAERAFANKYFLEKVFPVLTPQAVDPSHPFPYVSNLSVNLAVMVESESKADVATGNGIRFARVKLPSNVHRLVPIDETGSRFTLLGSLIAANADKLFPEMKIGQFHLFRVTRDADIEIREDEANDLLRTLQQHLRRRRFGAAVRLEVSSSMPRDMVEYLMTSLDLGPEDVYAIDGPMNVPDLMRLFQLDRPELKDRPLQVRAPEPLRRKANIFDIIRNQDVLLHHPFNSFTSTVADFIDQAARDPEVVAIKMCLYRTGRHSPIVKSLMEASERGKQVAVLVELKARFDEENNIEWARQLEEAGVHVVYGLMGLKTHCKVALVVRNEGTGLRRYVHIASGNYNPATARIYTDVGLFTADDDIGEDVTNLFNYLTGYSKFSHYKRLMVAPMNLRKQFLALVDRETRHAEAGHPARIIAKMNSLTDLTMVESLYRASRANVQIDLIIRGICILQPGIPGVSENIRVRSIVGRLLEHSRILYFENKGNEEIYIGSADWMSRNLDRRVEVVTSIRSSKLRKYLKDRILGSYLRDNVKARILQSDGTYTRVQLAEDEIPFACQTDFEIS
jgi:polyphosphate kinase